MGGDWKISAKSFTVGRARQLVCNGNDAMVGGKNIGAEKDDALDVCRRGNKSADEGEVPGGFFFEP